MRKVLGLPERGSLAPPALLAGLLALGLIGGAFLLTRPDPDGLAVDPVPATTARPEDHSLTDAEAIARFQELDALRISTFEKRVLKDLGTVFVAGGADHRRATRTIRRLRKDEVFMRHDPYETLSVRVLSNSENLIELEQRVILDIEFFDSNGRNVTNEGAAEKQRVRWTLKWTGSDWLIADGEVVDASRLGSD